MFQPFAFYIPQCNPNMYFRISHRLHKNSCLKCDTLSQNVSTINLIERIRLQLILSYSYIMKPTNFVVSPSKRIISQHYITIEALVLIYLRLTKPPNP